MLYDQPPAPVYQCVQCTPAEQKTLSFLQDRGIVNKNALATVMGNIKQESNFNPLICEGGANTGYQRCTRGGFGLIQWTTEARYLGLGRFCRKNSCNVNSLEGQLRYMWNEQQFQTLIPKLKTPGKTIPQYMSDSWYWLGWGIHGNRTHYAYQYHRKMELKYVM